MPLVCLLRCWRGSKFPAPIRTLQLEQKPNRNPETTSKNSLSISSTLHQPVISKALYKSELRIYFDSPSSHSLASRPFLYRPSVYVQCTPEGTRGRRWKPLSVSFTLASLLPLSNCPVLSVWIRVSSLSPDRQSHSADSLLYVRLPPRALPFYRHRPASWSVQLPGSFRARCSWIQMAAFEREYRTITKLSFSILNRNK